MLYKTEALEVVLKVIEFFPDAIKIMETNKIPTKNLEEFIARHPDHILYVPKPNSNMIITSFIKSNSNATLNRLNEILTFEQAKEIIRQCPHKVNRINPCIRNLELELIAYSVSKSQYHNVRKEVLFEDEESYKSYPDDFIVEFFKENYKYLRFKLNDTRLKRLLLTSAIMGDGVQCHF